VSQSGWLGWIQKNKVMASIAAAVLVVALVGIGVAATHSSSTKLKAGGPSALGTGPRPGQPGSLGVATPGGAAPGAATPGGVTPGATGASAAGGTSTAGAPVVSPGVIPGTRAGPACTPAPDHETGISTNQVRIGQIVSDVSSLPAQLKPNYYGLQAYVNLVNSRGGICGRKLVIDYSNDNANPATHDYSTMIHSDFAFVANSSLLDSADYQSDAPFNPTAQDNGEFVPDIGGLAYSYGRNQSPWFAGTVGSLSPSLGGGALYHYLVSSAPQTGHGPCRNAGVAYLREPTGSSQDQGRLGEAELAASWGANLGTDHVKEYENNLDDQVPAYEATVLQMERDGVNCVYTYSDLQSDINLVLAMQAQGVWPPDKCKGTSCFAQVYVPFAAYDPKFIQDTGDGARFVYSWLPHTPLTESGDPALQFFESALKSVPGATPSTFALIGFSAGVMFAQALQSCGPAPTRLCVMSYVRGLQNFTHAGLTGPITPFRSTKVSCASGCGNFTTPTSGHGIYNFKWIFNCGVAVQISDHKGVRDWYRTTPAQGFTCDQLRVVRGTPA